MNNNAYDISQLHAEWAATDNGDPMAEADLAETINRMEQPRGTKRGGDKICQPINFCKGYIYKATKEYLKRAY